MVIKLRHGDRGPIRKRQKTRWLSVIQLSRPFRNISFLHTHSYIYIYIHKHIYSFCFYNLVFLFENTFDEVVEKLLINKLIPVIDYYDQDILVPMQFLSRSLGGGREQLT